MTPARRGVEAHGQCAGARQIVVTIEEPVSSPGLHATLFNLDNQRRVENSVDDSGADLFACEFDDSAGGVLPEDGKRMVDSLKRGRMPLAELFRPRPAIWFAGWDTINRTAASSR